MCAKIIAFFLCVWFDSNNGIRQSQYGITEVKHKERLRDHDNSGPYFRWKQVVTIFGSPYFRRMFGWPPKIAFIFGGQVLAVESERLFSAAVL
jgi:hypothetical protein